MNLGSTNITYDEGVWAAAGALIGGMLVAILAIVLVLYILYIIGAWKTFVKAGEPGWKAIIPIYNIYTIYKFSWKASMFWVNLAIAIIGGIATSIGGYVAIIGSIASIITFVINIMSNYKLSSSFGHGVGFTIGLTFLPNIFILILGFGSSEYVGPQE